VFAGLKPSLSEDSADSTAEPEPPRWRWTASHFAIAIRIKGVSTSLADVRIDANQPSCMLLGVIAIVIAVPAITSTKRMHDGGFV
jgi:hypothetical protein